jgi:alkylhydroperoxidase family enzyme
VSYIEPPARLPLALRLALFLVERRLGRRLLANRILAWYPRAMVGSGIMEAMIAHDDPEVPRRLLALIRVSTSFLVSCPFCIDLNARDYPGKGLSDEEIRGLQGLVPVDAVASFSSREKAALRYVQCICSTPVSFAQDVIDGMREHFSERGMVIVASTCAQVNFWARLIQSLGVPPAGFSAECAILNLDRYRTMKETGTSTVRE